MGKRKTSKKGQKKRLLKKADRRPKKKNVPARTYTGVFSASKDGFGFVIPDSEYGFDGDVFIPAKHVCDAVDGDEVKFTVSDHYGRREGKITSVSKRNTKTFIGIYKYIRRVQGNRLTVKHVVLARDRKLCFDTLIAPKDLCGALDNDIVLCEVISYPDISNRVEARGKIIRVYGNCEDLKANSEALLDKYGIRTAFPEPVIEQADNALHKRATVKKRSDLRYEDVFTIDGAGAKDMDDAISVKRTENGFELGVHIADVSEYVTQDSAADKEALLRGTSVYYADKVIPMLPAQLSNGICSLNPGVNRYTLSVFMQIDGNGNIIGSRIEESVIRSKVRGAYHEVNDVIEKREKSRFYKKYFPVLGGEKLDLMLELYKALLSKSERRGALDLDSPEIYFEIDESGVITDAKPEERGISERIIEQFMLAANEAVATKLKNAALPCVYRVHGTPDQEKLSKLKSFVQSLCINSKALSGEEITLHSLKKLIDDARKENKSEIVSYYVLRCMMKAEYSAVHSPHFGLGAKCYCHFTSPIRRYPDLFIHRVIKALLLDHGADSVSALASFAVKAAKNSNEGEEKAVKLERDMQDLYMAVYMKDKEGQVYDAVITSTAPSGYFVRIPNGAEGFVKAGAYNTEYIQEAYLLYSNGKAYRPGDQVRVRLQSVSVSDARLDFEQI